MRPFLISEETPRDSKFTVADLMESKAAARPSLAWTRKVTWNLGVRTEPSELFALKGSDVDWKDSTIRGLAAKARTARTTPLSPEL